MFFDVVKLTREVKFEAHSAGASLIGVADLGLLTGLPVYGGLSLDKFRCAVSMAVVLPREAIERITVADPGILYASTYRTANLLLEEIAFRVASRITALGYNALTLPPSLRVDREKEVGHASQKAFAWAAGMGWIGRSGLLVTPKHGPRVRLITVLTDMPLEVAKPVKNRCGRCQLCVKACPSKALKYVRFTARPRVREEIFDAKKCADRLARMKELLASKSSGEYGVEVCGICMKVCPYGRRESAKVVTGNFKT